MKKILITGNSGYIGSHLCKMLKDEYELYGMDMAEPKQEVRDMLKGFYHSNIRNPFPWNNIPSDFPDEFDAVIHLAALVNVGESEKHPIRYYLTNTKGTLMVLEGFNYKNFIFASTGAAEGCGSPYGISKRAAEDMVREYCTSAGAVRPKARERGNTIGEIPYTIFRFYNVIGTDGFNPTNPDGLMYNLMKSTINGQFTIYGNDYKESWDGTCVRDYVHVMEICEALKDAIETPANGVECLGHGVGYTVKEIVDLFKKVNGTDFEVKYGPRRKGDLPSSVLENVSPYMKNLYSMEELLKI